MENTAIVSQTLIEEKLSQDQQDRLNTTLQPEEVEISSFSTIRQGNNTNTLTKIRPITKGETANTTIDSITGKATITKGDLKVSIPSVLISGLKTSTYQLLDTLTVALTEAGTKSPQINLSLSAYMKLRGLGDRKEAKNQVKADLEVLRHTGISLERKEGDNIEEYCFINIADSGHLTPNGEIRFSFGASYFKMIKGCPVMPYPAQLLTLRNSHNPNSYYLLRKITEHKNMNVGKLNEDIISVNTLLSVAPYIPSYDEVMRTGKQLYQRIIKPFQRDLHALKETLSWSYCTHNGQPYTAQIEKLPYEKFKELLVKISWKTYPDQTARLERKAKKIEQASQKATKRTANKNKKQAQEGGVAMHQLGGSDAPIGG